jgi:hypothetical protein
MTRSACACTLKSWSVAATGLLVLIAVAAYSQPSLATTYNPATTFEAGWVSGSNPNGVWSYGYSSSLGGPVTLYTAQVPGADSPSQQQMWIAPSVNCCVASPSVGFNNGPAFNDNNVAQAADQIDIVSAVANVNPGFITDLVFTAPVSGNYSLTSSFIGDQYGVGVGVDVLEDSSVLFSSSVTSFGQVVPFNTILTLAAGNTVTFAVVQGSGSQNTGLDVSLTTTPLPSTWLVLLSGLFGLGLIAFRRQTKRTIAGIAIA